MNERIWFAQMLRGIAALSVYFGHCVLGFWAVPSLIPKLIQTPEINYFSEGHQQILHYMNVVKFNLGPFGVALFFLISGFVIPFSIERCNLKQFAVKRFFRIFPTYALGLGISCLILIFSAHYIGEDFKHTFYNYLVNITFFLLYILDVPTIDYLNWTLVVEVYFYLTMAVFIKFYFIRYPRAIFLYSFVIFMLGILLYSIKIYSFNWITHYLIFMSIGTIIYQNFVKRLSVKQAFCNIVFVLVVFYIYIYKVHNTQLFIYIINYGLALIVFLICYVFNDRLNYNIFFNFMAEISYPLYVIHGVGSYAIMSILYEKYENMPLSLLSSVVFSFGGAVILHYYLEKPMIKLSNIIAKKLVSK